MVCQSDNVKRMAEMIFIVLKSRLRFYTEGEIMEVNSCQCFEGEPCTDLCLCTKLVMRVYPCAYISYYEIFCVPIPNKGLATSA